MAEADQNKPVDLSIIGCVCMHKGKRRLEGVRLEVTSFFFVFLFFLGFFVSSASLIGTVRIQTKLPYAAFYKGFVTSLIVVVSVMSQRLSIVNIWTVNSWSSS